MRWDPAQYNRFAEVRGRAFADLIARITATTPRRVVDVGCGPGTLTGLLARRWPDAVVQGVDSSPEMIEAAAEVPGVSFTVGGATDFRPGGDVDVVVSNAALHWVPGHHDLIRQWAAALPSGGWLAVQVPGNFHAPSHTLMRELAEEPRWAPRLRGVLGARPTVGTPRSYAEALLAGGMRPDAWETTYLHVLAGDDAVLQWVRGTALRPILAALAPEEAADFESRLGHRLREAYPPGPHGTFLPFRRIFAVGHKP